MTIVNIAVIVILVDTVINVYHAASVKIAVCVKIVRIVKTVCSALTVMV